MVAVKLKEVSKRYGTRWALIRLSLELPLHETILLTGNNGAGKTTLLRVLATALSPTRGDIEIFGSNPHPNRLSELRPRIGLLTHKSHLYEDLSAEENLALVARFSPNADAARIPEVLERVGLAQRAHSPVRCFSAGMQRRLCLGRILLREPELVLLDEPFGQLDPHGVELVEQVIRELRQKPVTLVISTHDIDRGLSLCDRRLHMVAGRLSRPLPKPGEVEAKDEPKAAT